MSDDYFEDTPLLWKLKRKISNLIEPILLYFRPFRKAASRLTVNPFGSQASHFPYIALTRDTEEDIAGGGRWLRVSSFYIKRAASWHNRLNNFGASALDLHHFAENNPDGLCRRPYPRRSADSPYLLRKQRETLQVAIYGLGRRSW